MKKTISVLIAFCFVLLFTIPSFALSINPYGSITESTSQVKTLISLMLNSDDYFPLMHWFAVRTGEYEYYVFYNIDDLTESVVSADYYRMYANQGGYNITWNVEKDDTDNLVIPDFTSHYNCYVGSSDAMQYSDLFSSSFTDKIVFICLLFISLSVLLFVFRVNKRSVKIS